MKPLGSGDPAVVGSFRILGVLGGGGMGRVYMGESRSGRRVAIKVIRSELAEDSTFRRRFAREIAAIRTVSPLFTASVVEADPEAEAPWVATTYIDGPTLNELVTTTGRLAGGAVLTLAAGLADALASIHRAGLVHRDIKPSNVIINDLGPHVIDFGIALTLDASNLTTSLLLGTPSYIAPEIIQGADPSPASDVFSLGSTLAFAATGRHLVSEGTVHAQILRMTMGRFDLADLPKELKPLIVRCLSPRPKDRPTADELAQIVIGSGVAPAAPGWFARPDPAPPVSVPPLPITFGGQRTLSRRGVLIGGGLVGAAILGTAAGAAAAVLRRPAPVEAALRPTPASPTPTPNPGPAPRRPGSILWQARSGVASVVGAPNGPAGGMRVIVTGSTIIGSRAGQVFAVDTTGVSKWQHPLLTGVVTIRPWGDGVLVTDPRTVWLLKADNSDEVFSVPLAQQELATATAEGQGTAQPEIGAVAVGTDRAFFGLGTATIALDRKGTVVWRVPGTAIQPAGAPLAAQGNWLVTQDPLPGVATATPGATMYRLAVRDVSTGSRRWRMDYAPVPFVAPNGPPPGPGGGPPGGGPPGGGPPGGGLAGGPAGQVQAVTGPPMDDEAWQRHEAVFSANQVVVRDAQEVRAFALADGRLLWTHSSQTPVSAMVVVGDIVLVAASQISAYSLATGVGRWQAAVRGARLAGTLDGRAVVVASDSEVSAIDTSGNVLWETPLPQTLAGTAVDTLIAGKDEVYLTVKPRENRDQPLPVDVVAFSLT
jgi:serine/threonine protein kinase/outer membrane protein assembly factor BamB